MLLRFVKRLSTLFAALLAGSAIAAAPATPAFAHPNITYMHCESPGSEYHCLATWNGTVGTVTTAWYENGVPIGNQFDGYASSWCYPGTLLTVNVVVTDAAGSSSASHRFRCGSGS